MQPNSDLLRQVQLDSASLTQAVDIVAQVTAAGRYVGEVKRGAQTVGRFTLDVMEGAAQPNAYIDLSGDFTASPHFTVALDGYVIAHVGSGAGGLVLRVYNASSSLLDNTALQSGQLVVFTLVRPGKHVVEDVTAGGACEIEVAPYTAEAWERALGEKVPTVTVTGSALDPKRLTLVSGQPLTVKAADGSRIRSRFLADAG